MIFQDMPTNQLVILWVGATIVAVGVGVGSKRVADWAEPGDFVTVCSDSVPAIPPPSAGLAPRVEALDVMIACTERMEVQYIERGTTAARVSMAAYALIALILSVALVATRRSGGGKRTP